MSRTNKNKYTKYDDALLKAIKDKEPFDEELNNVDNSSNRTSFIVRVLKKAFLYGCILALVVSYVNWHSVLWAIAHSVFSWFYILYFVIRY